MPRLVEFVVLCAFPVAVIAAPVVGSGTARTETRAASGFRGIAVAIPASVEIRQGASEGVTITAEENVLPLVETKVVDGVLSIQWRDRNAEVRAHKLEVVVDAKAVDKLTVGGSGSLHARSLAAPALSATIGGSGSITIDKLETDALRATIAGSGQLTAAGRAHRLDATLAGSGGLAAANLQARDAQLALQGSADATVRVRDSVAVTIAGSASVTYYGKPKVAQTVMGSGSVRSAGD